MDERQETIEALRGRFAQLAQELREAAEALANFGRPPSRALVEALEASIGDFEALRAGYSTGGVLEGIETLVELEQWAAKMARQRRARKLAQQARALRPIGAGATGVDELVAVVEEHAGAVERMLEAGLDESSTELEAAAARLDDLLAYVERRGELDLDALVALQERIDATFGRKMQVAISMGWFGVERSGKETSGVAHVATDADEEGGADSDGEGGADSDGEGADDPSASSPGYTGALFSEREFARLVSLPRTTIPDPAADPTRLLMRSASVDPPAAAPDADPPAAAPDADLPAPDEAANEAKDAEGGTPSVQSSEAPADGSALKAAMGVLVALATDEAPAPGVDPPALPVKHTTRDAPSDATSDAPVEVSGEVSEVLPETSEAFSEVSEADVSDPVQAEPRWEHLPLETLAGEALADWDATGRLVPDRIVWKLMDAGEPALAYHVARGAEESADVLSWRVLRTAMLGSEMSNNFGPLVELLREDFQLYDSKLWFFKRHSDVNGGVRLLVAAGALIPAVIAGNSGAPAVLQDLRFHEELGCVYTFCQELAECNSRLPQIDTEHLRATHDQARWEQQRDELRAEIDGFCAHAPARTTKFQRASDVWRRLLEPDQPIGRLVGLMAEEEEPDARQLEAVRRLCQQLDDLPEFDRLIHSTDRKFSGARIEGRAIEQLRRFRAEPVELAHRYVALYESNPRHRQYDFVQNHVSQLRQSIRKAAPEVRAAVKRFAAKHPDALHVRVGARYFLRALGRLEQLFTPGDRPLDEVDPLRLLDTPLLRVVDVQLEPEGRAPGDAVALSRKVLAAIAAGLPSYEQAFDLQIEREDHVASFQLLEHLVQGRGADEACGELERRRAHRLDLQVLEVRGLIEATRRHLERTIAFGVLSEADRAQFASQLDAMEQNLDDGVRDQGRVRLGELRGRLQAIDEALLHRSRREIERLREQLAALAHRAPPEDYRRIEALLASGDSITANDYIDMLKNGESLPELERSTAFAGFFEREQFRTLEEALQNHNASGIQRAVRERKAPGLDLSRVPKERLESASEMLSSWFHARMLKERTQPDMIGKVLTGLGFHVESVQERLRQKERATWYSVRTQTLRDRHLCPLPSYGSRVNGHYEIVCVWQQPSEDVLLSIVGENDYSRGTIVFYFGRLSESRRRELAAKSHAQRRTFLVLDDLLIYWLCGVRSDRLPVFFQCAFPFTYSEPFVDTASLVPPEMFYGRRQELAQIADPYGTCFIYGGRQLGKTALLRHVVRERHAPDEGRIVLWIDLKARGLGLDQDIGTIGTMIAEELKSEDVFGSRLRANASEETIYERIAGWLDEDRSRRILLLLDEADHFLAIDAQRGFKHCARLKNLMERTDRRFKVVFAGLHNVQRTTRQENQPLAHFGEPICIGPLWENGEWREALQLIKTPFETMGFTFESDDVPFRILSLTNFYPSLLQLFGKELLRHLHYRHDQFFDTVHCPPYPITSKHLQDAYQSQSLRDNIRHKFKLTLQLDQRYEVIAYAIAFEIRHYSPGAMVEGLPVSRVRQLALEYWRAGFARGDSDYDIRVLLDEMVGLGVLRRVEGGNYTLRNSNVVLLLGTDEEIEAELLRHREPPAEYDAASFRSTLTPADGEHDARRRPLTAAQEIELREPTHGVTLLFGTPAAGFDDTATMLCQIGGDRYVCAEGLDGLEAFERWLDALTGQRRKEGVCLYYVPPRLPWDVRWLQRAAQATARLTSPKSFVRIVFGADPGRAWALSGAVDSDQALLEATGLQYSLGMEPWKRTAVLRWLEDARLASSNDESLDTLSRLTGNWSGLLYEFYDHHRANPNFDWTEQLEGFQRQFERAEHVERWLRTFGVLDELMPLFERAVTAGANFDVEHLLEADGSGAELAHRFVVWCRWLRLANDVALRDRRSVRLQLDPVVHRLVENSLLLRES